MAVVFGVSSQTSVAGFDLFGAERFGWPEGEEKQRCREQGQAGRNEEQLVVIDGTVDSGQFTLEGNEDPLGGEVSEAKDKEIEQTLGAGADILGECRIDEDIERGEEEGITDAVQNLDNNDDGLVFRQEGKDREPQGVAENAKNHRGLPAQFGEEIPQNGHGSDFRNLPDAHHRHDPLRLDADRVTAQKATGHQKVAIVDGGVNEGDNKENQQERFFQKGQSAQPSQRSAFTSRFGRSVGELEAEDRERKRCNP